MKVRVSLVIEVDPQKWADVSGLMDPDGNFKAFDVREDVKSYFLNHAQQAGMTDEADAEVSL